MDVEEEESGDFQPAGDESSSNHEEAEGGDEADTHTPTTTEDSTDSEEDGKTAEEILEETLSRLLPNPNQRPSYIPSDQTQLLPTTVFKELVKRMKYVWFDLFKVVGLDFQTLESIRDKYPCDPEVSLFEAIMVWVQGETPKPSWKALVEALHSMLEGRLADFIARRHYTVAELEQYRKGAMHPDPTAYRVPPPGLEDEESEFSKLLLQLTDQLGAESFTEFYHFLKELRCPDGSCYLDRSYLRGQYSIEGILIPLLQNNLLVAQDMDLLIAVIRGLGRKDLMPLLRDYSSKINMQYPVLKVVQDTQHFFSLLVELHPSVVELDLEGVCYIKQDICRMIGVEEAPYLLQFLGWRKAPIVVQFQLHISLVDRIRVVVESHGSRHNLKNFSRFEIEVRGSVFNYKIDR